MLWTGLDLKDSWEQDLNLEMKDKVQRKEKPNGKYEDDETEDIIFTN